MALILDGSLGLTTPGVVNTAGETIATTLSVTGATNLAVSSGNVGIGTASPASKLDIGNTNNSQFFQNSGATTGYSYGLIQNTTGNLLFGVIGSSGSFWGGGGNAPYAATIGTTKAYPLTFGTNDTERMRIDASGNLLFNSGYGSVATAYGCRAWVNFNGTGTVAIRASGNVSSITDNGTGDYGINFTTAMPDASYSCVTSVQ